MSRFNVGGTSQFLFHLSKEIESKNFPNLLVVGDCSKIETEDPRLASLPHIKLRGLGPDDSILQALVAIFKLRRIIKEFAPDVINTHTSKAGFIGRIANATFRKRFNLAHTFHGHVFHGYFNPLLEWILKRIERQLMPLTDFVYVVGDRVLRELQSLKIISNKPYKIVWPYVPEFALGNRSELRKQLGISENATVIGWLGRKVSIKRLDRIVELSKRLPNCIFLIAGDGSPLLRVEKIVDVPLVQSNIIELGVSSPGFVWTVSDMCLSVSDNEGIPISPIESSIAGKPVIATNVGSTEEVVVHGLTGYLCQPNIESIVFSLVLLIDNPKRLQEFGRNAEIFAKTKFDSQRVIQSYIEGYETSRNAPDSRF
jgi:glycosyltransferase involved in cell wall biosynthesis